MACLLWHLDPPSLHQLKEIQKSSLTKVSGSAHDGYAKIRVGRP